MFSTNLMQAISPRTQANHSKSSIEARRTGNNLRMFIRNVGNVEEDFTLFYREIMRAEPLPATLEYDSRLIRTRLREYLYFPNYLNWCERTNCITIVKKGKQMEVGYHCIRSGEVSGHFKPDLVLIRETCLAYLSFVLRV